jgi:hypothetical protein
MAIIPADRIFTAVVGTNVGVEGGIPDDRTLGETADAGTYGDGVTDATAHIESKMSATGSGEYCYLPAGTYKCNTRLLWYPSFKTLRGDGTGVTTILLNDSGNNEGIHVGTSMTPTVSTVITAGATSGSTSITVTSTTGHVTGQLVQIRATGVDYVVAAFNTDPTHGPGEQAVATDPKSFSSMHHITNIVGNVLTINPALGWDVQGTPEAVVFDSGLVWGFGIEDLTLDCNGIIGYPIFFEGTVNCWVKNVEIKNGKSYGIVVSYSIFTEIRRVFLHELGHPVGGGPSTEGITLNNDVSWALIEDNIIYEGGYPGICLGNGFTAGSISGCVVGYNFSSGAWYNDDPFAHGISANHGGHNSYCIIEGNITDGFCGDSFYGSMSHITFHRNWGLALHPNADQGTAFAFNLCRWSNYVNMTGNVVGDSTFNNATQGDIWLGYPNFGNGTNSTGTWGPDTPPTYRLQDDDGEVSLNRDLNVEATLLKHGNYIYTSGGSGAQQWDGGIADHDLPVSLYTTKAAMEARGVVFPVTTVLPIIEPSTPLGAYNNTTLSVLPAGYRFVNGEDPPQTVPYSAGRLRCMIL